MLFRMRVKLVDFNQNIKIGRKQISYHNNSGALTRIWSRKFVTSKFSEVSNLGISACA